MKGFLYWIILKIAVIHDYILSINNSYEYNLSDKELHFLVMAIIGMLFITIIYSIFKILSNKNNVIVITGIYSFTIMLILMFVIEIGQRLTSTGDMELSEILFGMMGFLVSFLIFLIFRNMYHIIKNCTNLIKKIVRIKLLTFFYLNPTFLNLKCKKCKFK